MADALLRDPAFMNKADRNFTDLWIWHAIEETEHKAVAFDVLNVALRGMSPLARYRARVSAFIYATFIQNFIWFRNIKRLHAGHPWHGQVGYWVKVGWYILGWPGLYRRSLLNYCRYFLPGFHPWQHDNRQVLEKWRHTMLYENGVSPSKIPNCHAADGSGPTSC